ncbi:hypothetical protein M8J75_005838 [Diaphorina citri]|nr:hypothetical protein M8J75_005838 [Diaphorina citri]
MEVDISLSELHGCGYPPSPAFMEVVIPPPISLHWRLSRLSYNKEPRTQVKDTHDAFKRRLLEEGQDVITRRHSKVAMGNQEHQNKSPRVGGMGY